MPLAKGGKGRRSFPVGPRELRREDSEFPPPTAAGSGQPAYTITMKEESESEISP